MTMAVTIFWLSLALALYVYAGYPVCLWLLARTRRRRASAGEYLPTVTLLIAAYNEERVMADKIENGLALDYPRELITIVVASDGSVDRTNEIVEGYAERGVRLCAISPRGGKASALTKAMETIEREIVVLSDANTMYDPQAVRRLVRHFADPGVGAVSGDVRLLSDQADFGIGEGLYYRYERFIQRTESEVHSLIGADGAMYALRRSAFRPIRPDTVVDDLVIPLEIAKQGYRILYEPEAIAWEETSASWRSEFRRRVRVTAGGFQALLHGAGVPGLRQPMLLFSYVSHKLLRWTLPVILLLLAASSLALLDRPFYRIVAALQGAFYLCAVAGWVLSKRGWFRSAMVPFYFCLINVAALVGMAKGLLGRQSARWEIARNA